MAIGTLKDFANYLQGRGLSRHSITAFTTDLRQFLEFINGRNITDKLISEWFGSLKERGLTNKTLARKGTSLSIYAKWRGEKWSIPKVRPEKKLPEALSEIEARAVLQAATNTRNGQRDRLMVELMLRCGLRSSELLSLREGDLAEEDRILYLRVTGKGDKERRIPIIHKQLIQAVKKYTRGMLPKDLLFPMSARNLRKLVAGIGKKAGLERRLHPHLLRHTAATLYLRKGANIESVRRTLGHESLATTQKYLALTDEDVARDLSKASW